MLSAAVLQCSATKAYPTYVHTVEAGYRSFHNLTRSSNALSFSDTGHIISYYVISYHIISHQRPEIEVMDMNGYEARISADVLCCDELDTSFDVSTPARGEKESKLYVLFVCLFICLFVCPFRRTFML